LARLASEDRLRLFFLGAGLRFDARINTAG
jgi:hypothetical protein